MATEQHSSGAPSPDTSFPPYQAEPLPDHLTMERYTFALEGLCEVDLMLGVIWRERYTAGFDVLLPGMLSRAKEVMCLAVGALEDPTDDLGKLRKRFYHWSLLTTETELQGDGRVDEGARPDSSGSEPIG